MADLRQGCAAAGGFMLDHCVCVHTTLVAYALCHARYAFRLEFEPAYCESSIASRTKAIDWLQACICSLICSESMRRTWIADVCELSNALCVSVAPARSALFEAAADGLSWYHRGKRYRRAADHCSDTNTVKEQAKPVQWETVYVRHSFNLASPYYCSR